MTGEPDMPLNDADLFTIGVIVKQFLADTGLATLSEKEKRRAAKLRARLQRIEAELDAQD
jgi:ribosome-associated protein YbcJ (S4-like RNA binding protein)